MGQIAKIRTKTPINWGGANPFIFNKIEVEVAEISKNENSIVYQSKHKVMKEIVYTHVESDEKTVTDAEGKETIEIVETEISEPPFYEPLEVFSTKRENYNY